MKIYYCGISSKYIHTMPAGWFLAEYLLKHNIKIEELYHNVNEPYQNIFNDILERDIDILLLSVYIFNVNIVNRLIADIRKEKPKIKIVIGGPEADTKMDYDHLIMGEGEKALLELLTNGGGKIIKEKLLDNLDDIPSPYTKDRINNSKNKLIYYESSRGCPFSCAYCMASLSSSVRYFSMDRVKYDLPPLVDSGVKIIKFTDRTFNANDKRAREIIQFIKDKFSNSNTCFHFEVGGDLFSDNTIRLLNSLPIGLVQIEAGVQTLNEESLRAINRVFDIGVFENNIKRIREGNNIHIHLDLIAGLPYDTLNTFKESFDRVIKLRPHMLQLGFLKFLKETAIMYNYNAKHDINAPYEVQSTPYMSIDDLAELKRVEWVVDRLYNSGKFYYTLEYLMKKEKSAYELFNKISKYYEKIGLNKSSQEYDLYNYLCLYYKNTPAIKDLLKLDYVTTNNSKKIPKLLKEKYSKSFLELRALYKNTKYSYLTELKYLPEQKEGNYIIQLDYTSQNLVNNSYKWEIVKTSK